MLKFYLKFFIVITLICFSSFVNAQDCEADTCLLRITSGGSVNFRINSLNKYNDGVEYAQWTRLAVHFFDELDATKTWKLEFKALSIQIHGDGGQNIDLGYISLLAEDGGGANGLSMYIQPEKQLEGNYQTLIEGAPQGDFDDNIIIISYKCGKGIDKLLNEPPGYYVVDIELKLSAQ
ncbi:MAG: hypothetical protein ACOCWC_03645 [Bacteroidota bacterium]